MSVVTDRQFDKVAPGSLLAYDCSPSLLGAGAFRGVRVRSPARALYLPGKRDRAGAFARAMLCGSYRVDSGALGRSPVRRLLLVAVDAATHEAHAAPMPLLDDPRGTPDPPLPPLAPGERAPVLIEYFNVNLVTLFELPEREADYFAYAVLGEYVSNVVHLEVRREDRDGGAR